jgi:TP901 family phage tail tape measure protein
MTDFRINVVVDPAQAQAGTKKVERSLGRVEDRAGRVRRALGQAFALAGLGAGLTGTIRLLAEYSQELSTVQAVTNATAEQTAELDEEFKRLGATTRFSASQAAEGAVFLARAGFDANAILESLDDTLQLAQAGALGLGRAADIASNVLTGFRLDVDEASRVVDVLALAANSANTDVDQLGQALKFVAPVAAGVGVELEETTAAIEALSNAGLQASLAGTGLRRILSELESPAAKSQQILAQLGLTADDVRVSEVGLTEALQRLADAGVDTGTALELFGDRGGPAFEVLRNSIPDVRAATEELKNADGTAARIAATMDDNLNGALLSVKSAFEALLLAIGDSGALVALTAAANALAATLRFLGENAEVTAIAVAFLSSLLVASMVPSIGATIVSIKALNLALLTNPFTLIATAAATAIVALKAFSDELEEINKINEQASGREFSALTEFGKVGEQIRKTNARVEQYKALIQSDINRGLEPNPQQVAILERTEEKLAGLVEQQEKLKQNTDAARRAAEAQRQAQVQVNVAFDDAIAKLEDEVTLLGLNNQEREIQAELLKTIASIQKEGAALTPEQREQLEADIRRNQALRDQASVLDELRGPQEEFNRRVDAARILFEQEKITAEELAAVLRELSEEGFQLPEIPGLPEFPTAPGAPGALTGEGEPVDRVAVLNELNAALAEEERLLKLSRNARDAEIESIRIEQDLRRQGVELDPLERANLQTRVEQLQALARQGDLLEEIKEPIDQFAAAQADLKLLLDAQIITTDQYTAALERLKAAQEEINENPPETAPITAYGQALSELESFGVSALGKAKDALIDFAVTGEGSFDDFTQALLQDLKRILAEKALLALIDAFTGGAGSAGSGIFGAIFGRQEGGPVTANQPVVVGEEGEEIFTPPTAGRIIPAGETAAILGGGQQAAPQVTVNTAPPQVNITNVNDPDEIANAIEDGEADDQIMNVLQRKRQRAKGIIG